MPLVAEEAAEQQQTSSNAGHSFPLTAPSPSRVDSVFSGDMEWVPIGPRQQKWQKNYEEALQQYNDADETSRGSSSPPLPPVRMLHRDILLARLGRGQRIDLTCYAIKGLGHRHAKWCPVSTCFYDLTNRVSFAPSAPPITGHNAATLKKVAPALFDVRDDKAKTAFIKDPTNFAACKEFFRVAAVSEDKSLQAMGEMVRLEKLKDDLTFTVHPIGQYPTVQHIVDVALRGFAARLRYLKTVVEGTPLPHPKHGGVEDEEDDDIEDDDAAA